MAGKYSVAGSHTIFRLFEKAPNLIPQIVLDAASGKGDLTKGLVDLNIAGYARHVKRFYTYGRDKYPIGLPVTTIEVSEVDQKELIKATIIEAKKQMVVEAGRLQDVADALPGNTLAQDKADFALLLSTTLTVSNVVGVLTTDPNPYTSAWEQLYSLEGLFFPTSENAIEGASLFQNISGYWPSKTIYKVSQDNRPIITRRYDNGNGTVDYPTTIGTGYIDPPGGLRYLEVSYNINELGRGNLEYFVWVYKLASREYPDIFPSSIVDRDFKDVQNILPIVMLRDDKTWLDFSADTLTEEAETTLKMLNKINVDAPKLISQMEEAGGVDDMDAVYVSFNANLVSEEKAVIRYWQQFFTDLSKNVVLVVGIDYDDVGLPDFPDKPGTLDPEQQKELYESFWPPDTEDRKRRAIQNWTRLSSFELVVTIPPLDQDNLDPNEIGEEYLSEDTEYEASIHTNYIYITEVQGVLGKLGTTQLFRGMSKDYPIPEAAVKAQGSFLDNWIDYKVQITSTSYRLVRVHNPVVNYRNFWGGIRATFFETAYSLRGTDAKFLDPNDPFNGFTFPINYAICRTFSGNTETKIYYDSLIITIFSAKVTFIPGWKTFLTILIFIILIIIGILTQQWQYLIIYIVAYAAAKIIGLIVTNALGAEAGAKAELGVGIAIAIITLGAGIGAALNAVAVSLQMLGAVTQIISTITSIVTSILSVASINVASDVDKLLELAEESQRELDTLSESLYNNNLLDPLALGGLYDPYETPSEYYQNRLKTQPVVEVLNLVHQFVEGALVLPELRYEDREVTTNTAQLGELPETV